jgi:ABC-type antimicrobial peptide transport system permease subunit
MFYVRYVRAELLRRKGRTILTLLGLALGVGLVIAISSLSKGLDDAQKATLDPLAGIGTDLTVTRKVQDDQGGFGGPGGGGQRDVVEANNAAITDLSRLGKPGTHFVHDFFLPGTQLTFAQSQAKDISSVDGVAAVSSGLMLQAVHQEGTVPKIVSKIQTGGQQFDIRRRITPPTEAEQQQIQQCIAKLQAQNGGSNDQQRNQQPQGGLGNGNGRNGNGGGGTFFFRGDRGAFAKCLPKRMQQFRTTFTTPRETLQQVLDPPQTNIKSASYTIAGVQTTSPDMGLVTAAQVTKGRYFDAPSQALVAETYATRNKLKVGSTLDLNGTKFKVVGLVKPPLGGQGADVYVPLAQLQQLSGQKNLVNVVLVRADDSGSVGSTQKLIENTYSQAEVASSKQVADTITGSLVHASNLSHDLGLLLSVIAAGAAFLLAALLTLSSVGKRVRELGTLKALGWTQGRVIRQVAGESLAQGILGGVLGVALGLIAIVIIDAVGPSLSASSTTGGGSIFGIQEAARTTTEAVSLSAPVGVAILFVGFLLAVFGGLLAGAAGAARAARLRPADALRTVE